MGIRTDSNLQQPSVEDGHNPYTQEDMAIYTPQQIEDACQQQETLMEAIEGVAKAVQDLGVLIDRLTPTIQDVYEQLERLKEAAEYEELI